MPEKISALFSALLAALLLAGTGYGAPAPALQSFGGGGQMATAKLHARMDGEQVQLAIEIDLEGGFHLYADDLGHEDAIGQETEVEWTGEGLTFGKTWFPEPERFDQSLEAGPGVFIQGYSHHVVLYALAEAAEGAGPIDLATIQADISGLTCEDSGVCIPYGELLDVSGDGAGGLFDSFPAGLTAMVVETEVEEGAGAGGGAALSTEHSAGGSGSEPAVDYSVYQFEEYSAATEEASGGLVKWLLLAFLAGAILNVMPCVLPVISIKVLSFVQQAGEDKKRVFQLGLAFAAGIVVVFWALAAFAIIAGASWGEQFQNQGFLIGMIAVVFAFSLSMFGVYELGVPSKVGELASSRREGMGDAFFKGMLATALATPCSGPFLGSTLTWTVAQPPLSIVLIFTALGFGMAIPYVILTANPALLKKLPRPGPWMDTFKQGMGFVLVGTALFLMLSVKPELLILTLLFLLFVGFACWWYGRFATFDKPQGKRLAHMAGAFLIAGLGARLAFVDLGGLGSENLGEGWVHFEPDLLEESLAAGRPVFVDFTADWCVNCKTNKVVVYDSEEVQAEFAAKNVVVMEADETGKSEYTAMLERLRQRLGANSIPFMAVFSPDNPTEPIVHHSIITKTRMLEILNQLPAGESEQVGALVH